METFYIHTLNFIHKHLFLKRLLLALVTYIPIIYILFYPCILVFFMMNDQTLFFAALWKPLVTIGLVTLLRKIINRPRPYEHMDIVPLKIHKLGESFPSRHAASATIISLLCFGIHPYLGIGMLFTAIFMSFGRVFSGIHYISDIFASFLIATLIYFI